MSSPLLNNRYRIIQALGTGGFGETFLAEDTHMPSRRRCVIKQLKPVANNPQIGEFVQRRFEREAAILEQLGEGNGQIPNLYAYFTEAGRFYLVQEWISGKTLFQKVQQQGLLDEIAVKQFLVDILPVLEYIHGNGVIHRDIKPSNIIFRQQDGKPVLIDFGIAKEIMSTAVNARGEFTTSVAIGTRGYMSPEQAAGKPVFASDLYSLGLTAIYLLTGKLPHQLDNNLKTGEINWRQDNSKISDSLAAVIDKAVRTLASDRFSTAAEMLTALQLRDMVTETIDPFLLAKTDTQTKQNPEAIKVVENSPRPRVPTSPRPPYTPQEYRNRQILLNKVKNYWVKGVLETSIHGKAMISLGLEKRLDAVDRPWGMVWETPDQPRQTLPINTKIIDQFDQLGDGRTLLILGDPGSGKTTTLLELARDLINRAEQDINQPIPVAFNLSSWATDKLKIADWIVQELNTKYQVSKPIGQAWVKNEQLLLLLDGLDEVSPPRRQSCVQAINQFIGSHGATEIVVCSRIKEYEMLSNSLKFQGAIFIQPLTIDQIQTYLSRVGIELAAVKTALQADRTLQELAKSPLMLNIMTFAYQGMPMTDLPGMSLSERRQHLLDQYIQRMFDRRNANPKYSKSKAMRWLSWLAKNLSQQSQTVFLIERMQPSWLSHKWQKKLYFLMTMISFIVLGTVWGNILLPIRKVFVLQFLVGLIFWFVFGINQIKPVENLKLSLRNTTYHLGLGIILGALSGLVVKAIYDPLFHPMGWQIYSAKMLDMQFESLQRGVVFGLSVGIIIGIIRGLTSPSIKTVTVPNQGIRQSAKNALVFGLIGFLALALAAALLRWRILFWGIFGMGFGLVAGGGEACVKHFILRVILYCNGCIPWNYSRFLDYATERIFLQKVGGGYIFVHRLLLEHFAQMR
ncbi:protein kinase [Microseira sp. BLCC-F43]|jgi:serine/threonine protein kinase|uniref:protein kinase domain-containing protein n=1 Tax=Microseira sp. BLCC-F43 TaxID=3153602 RepID=UPI0035B97A5A